MRNLFEEKRKLQQKKTSYELASLNEKVVEKEKIFKNTELEYGKLLDSNNSKKMRFEKLQIAKYKKSIKEENENIALLNEQISKLDEDEDIAEIKEKLMKNSGGLRAYYLEEEEKLEKERVVIEGQIKVNVAERENYEKELIKVKNQEEVHKSKITELNTTINFLSKEIHKIEIEILDNPTLEKVDEQFTKWQNRLVEVEENVFNCEQKLKRTYDEKNNLNEELPKLREDLSQIVKEEIKLGELLKNIQEEHIKLLNDIKILRVSWSNVDSLYLRKESILSGLINKIERIIDEKETLLLRERLANRFLDDYKENEFYTADPGLEKWIKSWRNGFNYIETGTQFVQRIRESIGKDIKELYYSYPYWSISVIVSDAEMDKFCNRVNKHIEELSHPVFIMTEQEARMKITGEGTLEEKNIFPANWEKNLSQQVFENWKGEFKVRALEATENRVKNEEELNRWKKTLENIQCFYNKYSHEEYSEFQKEHKDLLDNISDLIKKVNHKETRIREIDEEIKKISNMISELKDEERFLENKILKAQEYRIKRNSKQKNEGEKLNFAKELNKNIEEALKWEKAIKNSSNAIKEIEDSLKEIKYNLRTLQGEDLYEEVRNSAPKYVSMSKRALLNQRANLKNILQDNQEDRKILELKLKNSEDNKKNLDGELGKFKKTLEFEAFEDMEFPIYGDDEIAGLLDQLEIIKKPLKKLKDELETAKSGYEKEKNTYEVREKDFYNVYDKIILFDKILEQVKVDLNNEEIKLNDREKSNQNRIKQLEKDKEEIEKAINELRIKNEKFAFLSESIKEIELGSELVQELPYKRLKIVSSILGELDNLLIKVEEKISEVNKEKSDFIGFCNSKILDVRLKEMAVSGIQYKKNFEDVIEWQQKMSERISIIIELAENDIKEHDKQLQQFINHLHSYISTMSQELKLIPKKTKIKIEDNWKEIYIFNVPEWDEKEGKEELSKHIDWMLKQLESDQFKNDEGEELEDKVSKAVEKWLQSKEILRIVMKQNTIKIKCRKVTNYGNISSMPFSWEQSNAWSGGEKWSKNMTLFLGILNYLAEKRKQVVSTLKRYRTVIVDNPFGKASSDHVLDPVFFIAEQLGFQIIALTAHAEGKFIRTYFPIVYSCKLREAKNGVTQIMTKEKEVKSAFFKDSDPQTLMRLGQMQQMGLFEY